MMKAAPWPVTALFALSLALNLWFAGVPDWRWIPAALAAWYVADLVSGLTHMYMDYRPCTPGIGLDQVFHFTGSRESDEYLALRDRVMPQIDEMMSGGLITLEPVHVVRYCDKNDKKCLLSDP